MEDIISHGDDRPPGGTGRRLLVAAALVAVVALVVVEHGPRGHSGGSGAGAGPGSVPIRLRVEGPAQLAPSGVISKTAWARDARLPRSGPHPDWFWPAAGRVVPILGLPSDRAGYVFTRVDGGWAIQPNPRGLAGCGSCNGPLTPVFYLADLAQRVIMVGSASTVAPAAVKGQVWLTTYPPRLASDLDRTPGVAQQYNGSGAKVGGPVTLPVGYGIIHGTSRGLLLGPLSQGLPALSDKLWDPVTRKVRRSFDGVLAVDAAAVAYAPPCVETCPVHVFNVRSGREVTVKMRPTDTATSGVFSPDGRFLALAIGRGNGDVGDGGASAVQLEVASPATGRAVVVPGIFVSSDVLAAFGWPGSRDDLVAEFSSDGAVQMASWDPVAGGDVAMADVRPTQDPAALVVG